MGSTLMTALILSCKDILEGTLCSRRSDSIDVNKVIRAFLSFLNAFLSFINSLFSSNKRGTADLKLALSPSYKLNGVVQNGHYCNNSNLVFSDIDAKKYSADNSAGEVPGQTRNPVWSSTKVLCETTTKQKRSEELW